MTKRELLITICENPGWQPPLQIGSRLAVMLEELQREGWIMPGLDGFRASDKALDEFPIFAVQEDIAAPEPRRDEQGRPFHIVGEEEVHWEQTFTLPQITVNDRQKIEQAIDAGEIKGSVVLVNAAKQPDRRLIEVTIKIRTLSARP